MSRRDSLRQKHFGMDDDAFKNALRRNSNGQHKAHRRQYIAQTKSPIEKLIYEIKPLFYIFFGAFMYLSHQTQNSTFIKMATVLVVFFGLYITYCRLHDRKLLR